MELFIGNIHNIDKKTLTEHFAKFNPNSVKVINGKGIGFITINDDDNAQRAIRELNGSELCGNRIRVKQSEQRPNQRQMPLPNQPRTHQENNIQQTNTTKVFPYKFVKRKDREKTEITAFHNELLDNNFDVAFDITWTTKTATALNPCTEGNDKSCPSGNDGEYAGYNKRWLITNDKRLAISPFTVKSAVANGFANIVGSCYRVISKEERHPKDVKTGTYYYNGTYKRYRVDRANSKPGIIEAIEKNIITKNGTKIWKITIKPVTEYLYTQNGSFHKDNKYYGVIAPPNNGVRVNMLTSARLATDDINNNEIDIDYYDSYSFGMDIQLKSGDLNKHYKHRFYKVKSGRLITAEIDELNFQNKDALTEKVYMGNFKPSRFGRDPRAHLAGKLWYEDLSTLNAGDWIYYQLFPNHPENIAENIVENIGKNFQFKALFCHEDTVPEGFEECRDINRLCPRCRLFGMTVETYNKKPDNPDNNETPKSKITDNKNTQKDNYEKVKALKGRFKASTLVSDIELTQGIQTSQIPFLCGNESNFRSVTLNLWKDKNSPERVISKQLFLPLQASPKPNKRDVDGYFDKQTGDMKGAKIYIDERKRFEKLEDAENSYIKKIDKNTILTDKGEFEYAHHLRNYAQVCDSNIKFKGVVGIDNGDKDEIAALIMLLETGLGGHAFKIGLGKAFGMGAVESKINKIWIRSSQDYAWKQYEIGKKEDWTEIKNKIGIGKELENFKQVTEAIKQQTLIQNNEELYYPAAGLKYWSEAKVQAINLDGLVKSFSHNYLIIQPIYIN